MPETPATDSILRAAEARGATAAGDYLKLNAQHMSDDERLRMQDAAERKSCVRRTYEQFNPEL